MEIIRALVETALLTHGLPSIDQDSMLAAWPERLNNLAWVEDGALRIGGMQDYLAFRARRDNTLRINKDILDDALEQGKSGALTASGTMEVCRRMGIGLAVSCGIGGIGNVQGEELCPDLPALADLPVALLATSVKDMLDIPGTFAWLREHGVRLLGYGTTRCTGYLFVSAHEELDGAIMPGESADVQVCAPELILNPIPEARRITQLEYLAEGIAEGHQAEAEGRYFHPAANAAFDRLSNGQAARIQLDSLIANALLAEELGSR